MYDNGTDTPYLDAIIMVNLKCTVILNVYFHNMDM